ncbi:MAG: hypothetical protein JNM30_18955 [Rhodospirillales bacterium]|nr:hypothetical protein [Rhodospirillales bacterium]
MVPILLSIAGALAGKAVVSAVEWAMEDKPAETPVQDAPVKKTSFTPEATKVSISAEATQKGLSARYDPTRLSPQRLGALADEMKANGTITAKDHQLMMRVAADARLSDIQSETGNRFLTSKNMVAELDRLADLRLKAGDKAEAARYQNLSNLLKDMKAKAPNATANITPASLGVAGKA